MILEAKQAVLLSSQLAYEEDLELSWRSLASQMKYAHGLLLKAARNPASLPELDFLGRQGPQAGAGAGADAGAGASGGHLGGQIEFREEEE